MTYRCAMQHAIPTPSAQPTRLHLMEKEMFLSSKTKVYVSTLGGALPGWLFVGHYRAGYLWGITGLAICRALPGWLFACNFIVKEKYICLSSQFILCVLCAVCCVLCVSDRIRLCDKIDWRFRRISCVVCV